MIQINLIPARTRKRTETAQLFVSVYFLSIVITVGAIAYLWITRDGEIQTLSSRLSSVEQEVKRYAQFEKQLQELTKRKETVERKRAVIEDLQKDRDVIVRILALLSVDIPAERMWFERLAQTGNTITIDGKAQSNEAVAEFMRNLEASPYVDKGSVSLTHSRQAAVNNMKLREFQVTYRFSPFSEVHKRLKAQAS